MNFYKNKSTIDIDGEVWTSVVNYHGLYEVSNLGRIKACDKIDCIGGRRKERMLSQSNDKDGYLLISLCRDRQNKSRRVHRLVAESFILNPNNYPQINHINGIKSDNRVVNLEWCDSSYNAKHARKIGLSKEIGETHKCATLTNSQVLQIFNDNRSRKKIADEWGLNPLLVSRIKTGKTWGSVTGKAYKVRKKRNLSSEDVLSIFNDNVYSSEIDKKYDTNNYTVNSIKSCKSYSCITGKNGRK